MFDASKVFYDSIITLSNTIVLPYKFLAVLYEQFIHHVMQK